MNKLSICFVLIAIIVMDVAAQQQPGILNVPEPQTFSYQSALNDKQSLQSQKYQDFIHQLYRFDKDNLKRVDNLFANVDRLQDNSNGQTSQSVGVSQAEAQQPSYADYIRNNPQPPVQPSINYFGISQDSRKRYKRSAQGAIFRPLFVYRIFQERMLEREEDRIRRRLNRRRTSTHIKNHYNN